MINSSHDTHNTSDDSSSDLTIDLVIGAGLAGLSTLIHSDGSSTVSKLEVIEVAPHVGGKARSELLDPVHLVP